jgi:hypothetical protein
VSSSNTFGLAGLLGAGGGGETINNVFVTGAVSSGGNAFMGYSSGSNTWNNDYYDIYLTGQNTCGGDGDGSGQCTGIDSDGSGTAYWFNDGNAPLSSWDFTNTWQQNAGNYPSLLFQQTSNPQPFNNSLGYLAIQSNQGGADTQQMAQINWTAYGTNLALWDYDSNASAWSEIDGSPFGNTFAETGLPTQPYPVYYAISAPAPPGPACMVISSPGSYALNGSVSGAPYTDPNTGNPVCVDILSSDVSLDCQGNTLSAGNFGETAIEASDVSDVNVSNCSVYGYATGVYYETVDGGSVENTTTSQITSAPYWLDNSNGVAVSGDSNSNSGSDGLYIFELSGSSYNSLSNDSETADDNDQFIYADGNSNDNLFANNSLYGITAYDGNEYGIETDGAGNSVEGNLLTGNSVYNGNSFTGFLDYGSNNSFIENNCSDNYADNGGDCFYGDGTGSFFWNNSASGLSDDGGDNFLGFYLYGGSGSLGLENNSVSGVSSCGYSFYDSCNDNLANNYVSGFTDQCDFSAYADEGSCPITVSGMVFDNPDGGFQNYTNLSISDDYYASGGYTIWWSPEPAVPPFYDDNSGYIAIQSNGCGGQIGSIGWYLPATNQSLWSFDSSLNSWNEVDGAPSGNTFAETNLQTQPYPVYYSIFENVPPDLVAVGLDSPASGYSSSSSGMQFQFTPLSAFYTSLLCNLTLDGAGNVTGWSAANGTLQEINISGIADGYHRWSVACSDGINASTSQAWNFTVDTTPPVVTLDSPTNLSVFNPSTLTFTFTPFDSISPLLNCSLYLDGAINQTDDGLANGTAASISVASITPGQHSWGVECIDDAGNAGSSVLNLFTIVPFTQPAQPTLVPLSAPQCTASTDCPDADVCSNGTCTPPSCPCGTVRSHQCIRYACCSDSDCGPGQSCTNNSCVSPLPVVAPPVTPPVNPGTSGNLTLPHGALCNTSNQCPDSQACDSGMCTNVSGECGYAAYHEWITYPCGSGPGCRECPSGHSCMVHVCMPSQFGLCTTVSAPAGSAGSAAANQTLTICGAPALADEASEVLSLCVEVVESQPLLVALGVVVIGLLAYAIYSALRGLLGGKGRPPQVSTPGSSAV